MKREQSLTSDGSDQAWPLVQDTSNWTGYYDSQGTQRFLDQYSKQDQFAMEYYAAIQQARLPLPIDYPTVPSGIPTYAVMANNGTWFSPQVEIYRAQKLKFANSLAGGNLSGPVVWYNYTYGQTNFSVSESNWTATALIGLGI